MHKRSIGLVLLVLSLVLAAPVSAAGPLARQRVAVAVSADRGEDTGWAWRLRRWLHELLPMDKGRATVSGNG